jgi:hypothetical protein
MPTPTTDPKAPPTGEPVRPQPLDPDEVRAGEPFAPVAPDILAPDPKHLSEAEQNRVEVLTGKRFQRDDIPDPVDLDALNRKRTEDQERFRDRLVEKDQEAEKEAQARREARQKERDKEREAREKARAAKAEAKPSAPAPAA